MGLVHSGDVMDMCYFYLCERWACCSLVAERYGIMYYARFRDDILIVSDKESFKTLWHHTKRLAGFFELKVEKVDSWTVE